MIKNRKHLLLGIFSFCMVATLSFFLAKNMTQSNATMAGFSAGNIMSDYVMGNYNSMNESQIQAFLKSKNSCNDNDWGKYVYNRDNYPNVSWHWSNGHFVCMADESFDGESAAHIIYRAAQDYHINPQVLIVLLQKEKGLVTDTYPHSGQYRSATGYGCPDTAACDSKYYGFKNQVRNAASLFRTVLDGGWSNYPAYTSTYVQYSPKSGCGGSNVYIENRATSALYRYTPYQPNKSAINSGYGTGDACGAYGNRNFYNYFTDWFGDAHTSRWVKLDTPRYMTTTKKTKKYNLYNNDFTYVDVKVIKFYTSKTVLEDGTLCLRTRADTDEDNEECVDYSDLEDTVWEWQNMETPRHLSSTSDSRILKINTRTALNAPEQTTFYDKKIILPDGSQCLKQKGEQGDKCVLYNTLKETNWQVNDLYQSRFFEVNEDKDVFIVEPTTMQKVSKLESGQRLFITRKILLPYYGQCFLLDDQSQDEKSCVLQSDLNEVWVEMDVPRRLKINNSTYKVDARSLQQDKSLLLQPGLVRKYERKIYADGWCLQTEYDNTLGTQNCVKLSNLQETWVEMENPREMTLLKNTYKIDLYTGDRDSLWLSAGLKRKFVSKSFSATTNGWCLRTEYDDNLKTNNCIPSSLLD